MATGVETLQLTERKSVRTTSGAAVHFAFTLRYYSRSLLIRVRVSRSRTTSFTYSWLFTYENKL